MIKYEIDKADRLPHGRTVLREPVPRLRLPTDSFLERGADRGSRPCPPLRAEADGDPLDVCVLTERPVDRTEILLKAHVIGGISMIDGGEADDKIIAVMDRDAVYGEASGHR